MKKIWIVAYNLFYEYLVKKDIYVLLMVLTLIIFATGYLTVFNLSGKETKILKDIPLFFMPIFGMLVAILTIFNQLDKEKKNKTLFPLLAKPITKTEFIFGKFLGSFMITEVFTLIIAFFYFLFLKYEGISLNIVFIHFLILLSLKLALIVSITLLISVFLTPSATFTISLLYFTISDSLPKYIESLMKDETLPIIYRYFLKLIYGIIPHTEIFDISRAVIHNWPPQPTYMLSVIILYGIIYNAFIIFLAAYSFNKKEL